MAREARTVGLMLLQCEEGYSNENTPSQWCLETSYICRRARRISDDYDHTHLAAQTAPHN